MGVWDFLRKLGQKKYLPRTLDWRDKEMIRGKWQEIEELLKLGRPSNFQRGVLEADKLLNFALEKMGYQGSLGEKLKKAKNRFSESAYNEIWQAHKIRNLTVHESNYELTNYQAKEAIEKFKRGLEELGGL